VGSRGMKGPKGRNGFVPMTESSRSTKLATETAWASASRLTYPVRLSTNGVLIPTGVSEYSRLRGGTVTGLQSQESNRSGSGIAQLGASDDITRGPTLSRSPALLARLRNFDLAHRLAGR